VGCHRYEGYDKEPEDLLSVAQQIKQIEQEKKDNFKQADDLMKQADKAESNEEANRLNDRAIALKVTNSKLELRIGQLDRSTKSLLQDMKKVGPNLKDLRLKLNKNWIPVWLKKPSDFRATTKCRISGSTTTRSGHLRLRVAVGAHGSLAQTQTRQRAHGKELFETRGCLACHSIGEGDEFQGGTSPRISLAWVRKTTTTTWCVGSITRASARVLIARTKKRTSVPRITRRRLPYVFDLEHSRCPNDGHELQVQNMTVMPASGFLRRMRKTSPAIWSH